MTRWLFWGLLAVGAALLGVLIAQPVQAAGRNACPAVWDGTFKSANWMYMPAPFKGHWQWHRDQAWIESNCRPRVCSGVGACGMLQLMPGTWADMTRQAREAGSVFQPRLNIMLGVRYSAWHARQWMGRPRSAWEVWELQLAGYNAGLKWILDAQALCGNGLTWDDIKPCLHRITGKHSRETINYVAKANRLQGRLP